MKALALLVLSMLPIDMASYNARSTLHLLGFYGAKLTCQPAEVDGYVCVARLEDGYAILRCSGSQKDACTVRTVRRSPAP